MARVRTNLNSFSTGFVSKKIRGNVDFEGYNNGLSECTNFLVQHTGGLFKRGGTEFIAYTKNNKEAELIPLYLSVTEAYMCEFGDLAEPDAEGNTSYIRFYTKNGIVENTEILHSKFTLDELRSSTTYQRGTILSIVMLKGIFTITSKAANLFSLGAFPYTYPPLTSVNYDRDKILQVARDMVSGTYTITAKDPFAELFYASDVNEVIALTGQIGEQELDLSLRINAVASKSAITAVWEDSLNIGKEPPISIANTEFLKWRISQFTEDRVNEYGIEHLGVAMYEGRLFLSAGNTIWGSSLARGDLLDFMPGTDDDSGLIFSITEMKSDDVLWIVGQSKLFSGTAGGLFMSGAATANDAAVTPRDFRVRLFQKLGSSALTPISANNTIFFVDSLGRNVHEIVLSGETDTYQANDLSLIAEDLTHSGIVSHTWQQSPIKTYWCVVNEGFLCSLTYLKNNGIMAWAKHEIAGKNALVESVSALTSKNADNIWMIVKRQITNSEGKQQIVRSIEYMHPIYDPMAQEEFKQFFVDSGKVKELKHTIKNITIGYNYTVTLDNDIRSNPETQEMKVMLASLDNAIQYKDVPPNPFCAFEQTAENKYFGSGKVLTANNFHKEGGKYAFDVFDTFDYIKEKQASGWKYGFYRNKAITHGKIDSEKYQNSWAYADPKPKQLGVFIKVADIRNVDTGPQTKIYCDTSDISQGDIIVLRNTDLKGINGDKRINLDHCYEFQWTFKVAERRDGSFVLSPLLAPLNIDTSGEEYTGTVGEVYKQITTINVENDPFVSGIFRVGSDAEFTVTGNVPNPNEDVPNINRDVYINKVFGMTEINDVRYKIKSSAYNAEKQESTVTLFDYTKSPDEQNINVSLDAYGFSVYDIDKANNGNMYQYFTRMDELEHLEGQKVSVCSNGNSVEDITVTNGGFKLHQPSMYCVAGLPLIAKFKTVPFSGGNALGSSVGVVGQQVHAVFNLYCSLGGKYGTEENKTYPFPYDYASVKPFNLSKNLFSGIRKLPLINAQNIYERCIYIEHSEPLSFNLLAVTEEISVTDA